jgi:hypothetical protein
MFGEFVPCCHLLHAGLGRWKMRGSQILVHSHERHFEIVLEKIVRVGEGPSHERRNARADIVARSINQLSRTGQKREEIEESVNNHFPALEEMVTCVNLFENKSTNHTQYCPEPFEKIC